VLIKTKDKNYNIGSDWDKINHGVPQGSILGPLLFLICINYLPLFLNRTSIPILFADDTSVLVTSLNFMEFNKSFSEIIQKLNKWFSTNLLSLNLDKTYFIHFKTKTAPT
jgi:hypothetical protein